MSSGYLKVPPLLGEVERLREMLADRGYAPRTIASYERVLCALASWPPVRRLGEPPLCEVSLRRAVARGVRRGECSAAAAKEAESLFGHLRVLGVFAVEEPTPAQRVLAEFRAYLLSERRLAPLTAQTRADVIRRFLAWRAGNDELALSALTVGDVHAFVVHEARRLSRRSLSPVLDSVRSFLRFAFATGILDVDLSSALPPIATRQHPLLRRSVDAQTLEMLLAACDRDTPIGCRDYAILMLLARLGLRANEVALMRLDDIDWRAGELLVHGKGGRVERMPLPADVGQPLVDYLRYGRAGSEFREVFLRGQAPAGPLGRNGVVFVPRRASRRAGIPIVASHRLRHTTASALLAAGASWSEVSQVLRHSRSQTTAIYTSAEPHLLDEVVHPWPGAQA